MLNACRRCGRSLTNPKSIEVGIGPVCRARSRRVEQTEDAQRKENLKCHHGVVCYAPDHASTTIHRFLHRFTAMAEQTSLPDQIRVTVGALVEQFRDALGLNRDNVPVPEVDVPRFGPETIAALGIPAQPSPFGGVAYAMPIDHDEQYRRRKLRQAGVCPFGLDCRDPGQAVSTVWRLVTILCEQVEPILREVDSAWSWDSALYQHLANSLEVLGLNGEGEDIRAISATAKRKRTTRSTRRNAHQHQYNFA
jgi:hypothetical protein